MSYKSRQRQVSMLVCVLVFDKNIFTNDKNIIVPELKNQCLRAIFGQGLFDQLFYQYFRRFVK